MSRAGAIPRSILRKERMPMNLSAVASTCSEITVILAALAMLIKPIRNKLVGQYFDLVN